VTLTVPPKNAASVRVASNIYISGGFLKSNLISSIIERDTTRSSLVERIDIDSMKSSLMAPLLTARHSHTMVAVDQYLYAIGGIGGDGPLSSIERYDIKADKWSVGPSLGIARCDHVSVVVNKRIYVFGGRDSSRSVTLSTGIHLHYELFIQRLSTASDII
jgi:N-acetylneuraminic acid mutarotase